MTSRSRSALVVGAPLVAVATLMLGLRVGAGEAIYAAKVFVAPPGKAAPGGETPLAVQILTYREERGVPETVPMSNLTVIARRDGKESRWTGSSNEDGIAEAALSFEGLGPTSPIAIDVLAAGEREPLATGVFATERPPEWGVAAGERGRVRPSKREGEIAIDVLVEGERLVVGFPTPVWVRTSPPAKLELAPEAGLDVREQQRCGEWTLLSAQAFAHVVGLGVEATADGKKGSWFGALPIAGGAFAALSPRHLPAAEAAAVDILAPNPRSVAYAEIDDEEGRVFAEVLRPSSKRHDEVPGARMTLPPLAPGLHWLVVSGEPRGAERLAGAAIAKPFFVGDAPGVPKGDCELGPWLAQRPAAGFPRRLAIDGIATRGAKNRARHRTGLFIGLVALFAAAALEVLLLTAASREARAVMLLAELEGDGEGEKKRAAITARPPGGNLTIALLVAVLGFALLAVLLFMKV